MTTNPARTQQQILAVAILLGALMFAVMVPFLLPRDGGGIAEVPLPVLDQIAIGLGAAVLIAVQVVRPALQRRAADAVPAVAAPAGMVALLVPLALLEAGMLFSCVAWLLNGSTNPDAVVFALLFLRALLLVPRGDGA